MIDGTALRYAAEVCAYLMELAGKFPERWEKSRKKSDYPFADLAYGEALADWNQHGRPSDAWWSTAPGQIEDPFLIEFKHELTEKFGLRVMECEEGMAQEHKCGKPVLHIDTTDWGPN